MRLHVVFVVELIYQDIVDHGVEKRGIGARADARIHVGRRGCAGESRIDMDNLGPIFLGLPDPFESHWMVLRHIAAFHQDRLAMLQVDPVVGHGAAPECCPQTGDRGAMSKSGLMLDKRHAKQTGSFLKEVALLVGILSAAHKRDRVSSIDGNLSVT